MCVSTQGVWSDTKQKKIIGWTIADVHINSPTACKKGHSAAGTTASGQVSGGMVQKAFCSLQVKSMKPVHL